MAEVRAQNTKPRSEAAAREEEVLSFWERERVFEKTLRREAPRGEFVFYDGPPFATGLPHHGSLLSSIIKDVIPRYKTMRGYRVRRRWGWDCHGLPIESLVEKELGLKTKKDIETIGIETFNKQARSLVLQFVHDWERYIERIGRWVDFKNSYKTMDNSYIESVWWALKELWTKNLLYEGKKVLMYCPHCETPLAKAEIAMDHTYQDITEEAVTVKLKIKNPGKIGLSGDVYLLAWTTTPWTLPGNVALAVGKDISYSIVQAANGVYVLATDLVPRHFAAATVKDLNRLPGSSLRGLGYEPLFDIPALSSEESFKVYSAPFVSTEEGTGIVHTAVMYGEDDFALGQREGLPMVQLLNPNGTYNETLPEFLRGKYIKDAERDIKEDLEKRGLLLNKTNHTHSYPHCYRCGTPLIYNAVSSWFINIQNVKARMLAENEKIQWFPAHLKHGRFKNIVESAPDWTISRNRFWASPLPIWKCEKCGKVLVVGSIAELKEKSRETVPDDLDLHRPYVDRFSISCECGGAMRRIPEVVDCWVESGSMPFAEWHYPFENKEEFEKRSPGDFIAEYIAQTRTWFYYMHAMGVLLFNRLAFRNVISTGTVLAENGEKFSKSKRNYTDPLALITEYGADALRFYLMSSPVMRGEDLNFRDHDVRDAHNRVIQILWNSFKFFELYQRDWNHDVDAAQSPYVLDRWILARLDELIVETTAGFDGYDVPRACAAIRSFVDDYSTWYIRRSRDRVKGGNSEEKKYSLAVQRHALTVTAKIIAPVLPFLAESIYRGMGNAESVHLAPWPDLPHKQFFFSRFFKRSSAGSLVVSMREARSLASMALAARGKAGIKVRQPLPRLTVRSALVADPQLRTLIAEEVNVKEVVVDSTLPSAIFLDTSISDELREEGMVRDLVRSIQGMRKDGGFSPHTVVDISISSSASGQSFITRWKEHLERATTTHVKLVDEVAHGQKVIIGDEHFTLKFEQ